MSQADRDSRLTVTTRTAGTEYYDQVLAMSSHVINDGWAKLYKTYTELQSISYEDDDVGKLNGELNPCRISFDGDNRAGIRVFYTIRSVSSRSSCPALIMHIRIELTSIQLVSSRAPYRAHLARSTASSKTGSSPCQSV